MRDALENLPKGDPPSHHDIQSKLGAFSSKTDGTEPEITGRTRERRGRRRRG